MSVTPVPSQRCQLLRLQNDLGSNEIYKGEKGYNLLIEKIIPNDSLQWRIDPEDTNDLRYGSYVYDLQITYADGKVETFADKKRFVLTEEVE